MASAEQSASQTKFEHTDKITTRRKALFPTDESSGSDLGHMSPIHSENSNFSEHAFAALEHEADRRFRTFFKCNLDDYVLLDDGEDRPAPEPCSESSVPSLYLSPMHSLLSTPILYSPMHPTKIITPLGRSPSPSSTLKTPHDTSTVKVNQKQTKRKLASDVKRPLEASQSPNCKHAKLDAKSRARTMLFPDDGIVLPAKSFYPKEPKAAAGFDAKESIAALLAATKQRVPNVPHVKRTQIKRFAAAGGKRRYGEINAGVRHKIRKPKQKKVTKTKIVRATMKIIEKSPLTEYLEEMINVKKTIKPLPAAASAASEKENVGKADSDSVANRKFFKTLRSSMKRAEQSKPAADERHADTPMAKRKVDAAAFDLSPISEEPAAEIGQIIRKLERDAAAARPALDPGLIFSPTAQMCDMASALDLNSPKRAKLNISKMLSEGTLQRPRSMAEKIQASAKLFPLFYADRGRAVAPKEAKRAAQPAKKFRAVADNQLLIDAGQKKFGATACHECSFVYEVGDPADEAIHRTFHDAINTFKFNGWKNERVVSNVDLETRIIKIIPSDSKVWWKKGLEVVEYINRELGFYDGVLPLEKSQMYLYIKNKKIVGCLTAEMKQTAYKRLPTDLDVDMCSEESYNIRCGISRIWVAPHQRRRGVASQLVNTLRRNFLHGYILDQSEIAMSSPTELGQKFAAKYFQTESFLIYMH